jgi:hypothetical protein
MKNEGNLISDWLEKYGDPEIEKKVELTLFNREIRRIVKEMPNDLELGKKIRSFVNEYYKDERKL